MALKLMVQIHAYCIGAMVLMAVLSPQSDLLPHWPKDPHTILAFFDDPKNLKLKIFTKYITLFFSSCNLQIYFEIECIRCYISVFCKSCEPMLCEPEIVQKVCS